MEDPWLNVIKLAHAKKVQAQADLDEVIALAIRQGVSHGAIADKLGVSRQAIQQRYNSNKPPREPEKLNSYTVQVGNSANRLFGQMLREARKNAGLAAKEVAEWANVHPSFVHGIERGAQVPSLATAKQLLSGFKNLKYEWVEDVPQYDLVIYTPKDHPRFFRFKAEVKGQNRR